MKIKVVQCWDDGVTSDIPLIEILRKYNAKASFNLNFALHGKIRGGEWEHRGTRVMRLAKQELRDIYEGFTVANHTMTHPHLEELAPDDAMKEIAEGRKRLQQHFSQPVEGFAYPYGTYNESVMSAVRDAGHVYGRTTENVSAPYPPKNPMAFHSHCHFLNPDFFKLYEAARETGVFYFWGHSYEMIDDAMFADFERTMKRINDDPRAEWCELPTLFD